MKRALVLGGTGMLGAPVVRRLVADGFHVAVLTRRPRAARTTFSDVAGELCVVEGDATDALSVREAAAGRDIIHVSVGPPADRAAAVNAARAAADVGVERLGYVSGTTVSEEHRWFPMIDDKLAAERAVMESGVPWTIFRPSWPFEQLARFARDGQPFLLGEIPHPWHFFAAADMARVVSRAYQTPGARGRHLLVHGPEALTLRQALERYCALMHPDAPPISVMPLWLARMTGLMTRNAQLRYAAALMSYFDKVGEGGDGAEANALLGAPTTTLEAWCADRLGVHV